MQITGTFNFGDMCFEYENEKAYDAYRCLKRLSHKVFLSKWYEEITGMVYDADDFPWTANRQYLNENSLRLTAQIVFNDTQNKCREIHCSEHEGVVIESYRR